MAIADSNYRITVVCSPEGHRPALVSHVDGEKDVIMYQLAPHKCPEAAALVALEWASTLDLKCKLPKGNPLSYLTPTGG